MRLQLKHHHPNGALAVDVDVTLPDTGITVLFGPSGAGKTSLLRGVAGLDRPQTAHIEVAGSVWQHTAQNSFKPTWQRSLGYVFQEPSLFEHWSVQRNLDAGMEAGRRGLGQAHASATEVIELLGIGHLLQRMPSALSGGERQRVAIARALLSQPSLLLLDEPLASIDQTRRNEILPWLERLRDHSGVPMLYVTHSSEELLRLAQHVLCLAQGRCTAQGPLEDLLTDPAMPLLGPDEAAAVLHVELHEHLPQWNQALWRTNSGNLVQLAQPAASGGGYRMGQTVRLRVMARDVSLSWRRPENMSIQNAWLAQVHKVRQTQNDPNALVQLRLFGAHLPSKPGPVELIWARVTRKAVAELDLREGVQVWALVKAAALMA